MRLRDYFPLVLVLLITAPACAPKAYHLATVSVVSAHATASLVQDEADASICGKPTAPPAPRCLTLEQRKALAPHLSEAFGLIGQGAETVKTLGPGATLGSVVKANLDRITSLLNVVLDHLPSEAQARIKTLTSGGGK